MTPFPYNRQFLENALQRVLENYQNYKGGRSKAVKGGDFERGLKGVTKKCRRRKIFALQCLYIIFHKSHSHIWQIKLVP